MASHYCYYVLAFGIISFVTCTIDGLGIVVVEGLSAPCGHMAVTRRTVWLKSLVLSPVGWIIDATETATYAAEISMTRQVAKEETENEEAMPFCDRGALTTEWALPGAYENACMDAPIRRIPIPDTPHILRIQQQTVAAGATGLAVWNSSLLLTRLLTILCCSTSKPGLTLSPLPTLFNRLGEDDLVVELGCGTGLVSCAAALLGAKRVIATDGNARVVDLARENIMLNNLQDRVQAKVLPWGLLNVDDDLIESAHMVLGSDLTYNSGTWPLLAETMAAILRPDGVILYVSLGHPGFNVQGEVDGFLTVAKSMDLVPLTPSDESFALVTNAKRLLYEAYQSEEEKRILASGFRVVALRKEIRRQSKRR